MAARSFHILLKNVTALTFTRGEFGLQHGEWSGGGSDVPPEKIAPSTKTAWMSESDGLATGTEGSVKYSSPSGDLYIHWSNPYVGENSLDIGLPPGHEETHTDISGNDAAVTITITPVL